MTTFLYSDPVFRRHDTGHGHPECSARLNSVLEALRAPGFEALRWRTPAAADVDQLSRVHDRRHIDDTLTSISRQHTHYLDGDTCVSAESGDAALKAAGAVCAGVDAVMGGDADNAFCAVRPPGHHATADHCMGFCLFNNAAVAAAHAIDCHGLARVAIVDFDVHHGNGTQDIFWDRSDVLYISSHQSPLYPGSGAGSETGVAGNILNLPLAAGSDGETMRLAYQQHAFPKLRAFAPELLLVSAGFDAHCLDPLAGLNWTEADYRWLSERLVDEARTLCGGRLVSTLEGGYHLQALAASVAAHVSTLMGAA